MALDQTLRSNVHYKWLSNVTAHWSKHSQVMELQSALDVLRPQRDEKGIFLSRLIPDSDDAEDESLDANRRAGMILTLRAVAAINAWNERRGLEDVGASEEKIRAAMARGCAPDGREINLSGIERAQAKWAVLQLRQYQRACFEAFYVALEYLLSGIIEISDRSKSGIAVLMGTLCEGAFKRKTTVADIEKSVREAQGKQPSLYKAALKESKSDVFECRQRLLDTKIEVLDGTKMPFLAEALRGFIFCAFEARNLAADSKMRLYLGLDDDKRPLAKMPDLVARFSASQIRELVAHIARYDVIERHYEVVAMRSRIGDEKNRFRFVESETGLRRYDDSRGLPGLSEAQDRLARALDLLEQCSLLRVDGEGYVLTAQSKKFVPS